MNQAVFVPLTSSQSVAGATCNVLHLLCNLGSLLNSSATAAALAGLLQQIAAAIGQLVG